MNIHAGDRPMDVVLLGASRAMHQALHAMFRSIPGARVAASTSTESAMVDWLSPGHAPWDLAVLDIPAPGTPAMPLIGRLVREHPAGHVVVLGDGDPQVAEACTRLGAHAVFAKSDAFRFFRYVCGLVADRCEQPGTRQEP